MGATVTVLAHLFMERDIIPTSEEATLMMLGLLNTAAYDISIGGYAYNLAPWFDNNEDGAYNPADGDYPFYDCWAFKKLR